MKDQELHDNFCKNGMLDNCGIPEEEHEKYNPCDECNDMINCLVGIYCPVCHPEDPKRGNHER